MRHFDVFNAGPCQFVAVILCLALTPLAISQTTSSAGVSDRAAADEGLPVGAGLNFSESPADSEFPRVGLFAQPLIPVGTTNPEENKELAALLTVYADALHRGNRDEVLPFVEFLHNHPKSAWKAVLQLNLGAVYRRTGHFSKALEIWQAAWDDCKDLTDPHGRAIGDMTAAYLSQLEAYLGREETLAPLLEELRSRPARGSAAEWISESSEGLANMRARPVQIGEWNNRWGRYSPGHTGQGEQARNGVDTIRQTGRNASSGAGL